ncbi:MAG: ribosome maturation factor RimM [Sporomusaceae bacterium]|jgi:16S rRNA processing protein RimM|nr:ribosome maturation factor RimM [Sporomusaceae bacterium]
MKTPELFFVGKIIAPHGVRGDVRIIPLTDFPERFASLKEVYLDDAQVAVIEQVRPHQNFFLVKFKGVETMDAAETLRGKLLKVRREDLVPLPEGHYYIFDIIGLKVFTETDELLGEITDVLETGSNDVYVVEQQGKPQLLLPALKEVVKKIDLENKRVIVRLQEEWKSDTP